MILMKYADQENYVVLYYSILCLCM